MMFVCMCLVYQEAGPEVKMEAEPSPEQSSALALPEKKKADLMHVKLSMYYITRKTIHVQHST